MKVPRNVNQCKTLIGGFGVFGLLLTCLVVVATSGCKPPVPPYPWWGSYGSAEGVTKGAQQWSAELEKHIKDWLDGRAPAEIPDHLLPESQRNDSKFTRFRLGTGKQ